MKLNCSAYDKNLGKCKNGFNTKPACYNDQWSFESRECCNEKRCGKLYSETGKPKINYIEKFELVKGNSGCYCAVKIGNQYVLHLQEGTSLNEIFSEWICDILNDKNTVSFKKIHKKYLKDNK